MLAVNEDMLCGAETMHQFYLSLQKAGFTKKEAMELVKSTLLRGEQK